MEGETIRINPNTVNCLVIIILNCLYIMTRSISSSTSLIDIVKGKFRSLAGLFLKLSILSSVCYNAALFFLSFKFEIDKVALELSHTFKDKFTVSFRQYNLDLAYLMVSSLKMTDTLLISCLFMTISLICNSKDSSERNSSEPLNNIRSKISSISKVWGICRVPLIFYSYFIESFIEPKLYLFFRLIFGCVEFGFVCIFIFFATFRNSSPKNTSVDSGFLAFCCFLYGFLKYTVNLIDFPFKLTSVHVEIITSSQFGILCAIYLLLSEILFPRKQKKIIPKEGVELNKEPVSEVCLLESVIVFDEKNSLVKKP